MFMLALSGLVPREGHTRVTFTIPEKAPAFSLPRRILVDEKTIESAKKYFKFFLMSGKCTADT